MTWFPDLSPCTYFGEQAAPTLRAIGWLERDQPYHIGRVHPTVYERLVDLCRDPWQPFALAGIHECQLCQYQPLAACSGNLFVPDDGFLYVCPQLITHYMNAHGYAPPDDFCAAVLACPPIRSVEYLKKVLANGGRELIAKTERTAE